MKISSDDQLRKEMIRILKLAIEEISEEVLSVFKKEYVQKLVYESHGRNKFYHNWTTKPTKEFLNAWDWDEIRVSLSGEISRKMTIFPERMSADADTWKHGSLIDGWPADARELLAGWLNKVGYSSSINVSVYREKAYWDEFYNDMVESGKLDKIIEKNLKRFGISKSSSGGLYGI